MKSFDTVRELFERLETDPSKEGQTKRIKAPVDKDWEIATVTRKCIMDNPKEKRPALLFENVKGYKEPVLVGVYVNRTKYAYALGIEPEAILEKWVQAVTKAVPPRIVKNGRCKERILHGDDADLLKLPIPVWTPGEDPGPYITGGCVITKDLDTGRRNVGTYRMQVKGNKKTGIGIGLASGGTEQHHLVKYWSRGEKMPVAIAIGADPTVQMVSVAPVASDADELAVAGGLKGEPIEVVKCETVDLVVPANAEIVLEGYVEPGVLEDEGPFGEYYGYVGPLDTFPKGRAVFKLNCITHTGSALWHAFISQKPPSESSNMRGIAHSAMVYKYLRYDKGYEGVLDAHFTENWNHLIIKVNSKDQTEVERILEEAGRFEWRRTHNSIITIVDPDIDIRDANEVDWAICTRVQPNQDIMIREDMGIRVRPYFGELTKSEKELLEKSPSYGKKSKVLINATKKWAYPPTALPKKEYFDRVNKRWPEYWT